jgi:hypothetical protein
MSIFRTANLACPACGQAVEFQVSFSVNADRRPDFRDAILDGSFQRGTCEACGKSFRMEPELTYFDLGRHQWILVRPVEAVAEWESLELQARGLFDAAYGEGASQFAQDIGRTLQVRVTFGWPALCEKILCAGHGLDDVTLELTKTALIRGLDGPPLADTVELRLTGVDGGTLKLAWVDAAEERVIERLDVPRALYDEIAADEPSWRALRAALSAGPYVDLNRLFVPAESEAPAGAEAG